MTDHVGGANDDRVGAVREAGQAERAAARRVSGGIDVALDDDEVGVGRREGDVHRAACDVRAVGRRGERHGGVNRVDAEADRSIGRVAGLVGRAHRDRVIAVGDAEEVARARAGGERSAVERAGDGREVGVGDRERDGHGRRTENRSVRGELIDTVGVCVSTTKSRVTEVVRPTASVARTTTVCGPWASPVRASGRCTG